MFSPFSLPCRAVALAKAGAFILLPSGKSEDGSKWDPRGIEPELTASRSVMHPRKEPPDCAAQQRETRQTQYYFQNDEANLECHVKHETPGNHNGHLNCR
jgi:hypothetical protein